MSLREAVKIGDRYIDQQVATDYTNTQIINRALDAGLARLRTAIAQGYPLLQNTGSLAVTEQLITQVLGSALYLLPLSERSRYEQFFNRLVGEATGLGSQMGADIAGELSGEVIVPNEAANPERGADAARRLYVHVEEFRAQAIALIGVALQQGWSDNRVADQLSTNTGKLKGRVSDNLTKTESATAIAAGLGIAYLLMDKGGKFETWNVSRTENTCGTCLSRDGNVYQAGAAYMPAHGRCHCFFVAWDPSWDDKQFRRDRHTEALDRLAQAGLAPSYGSSPFERGLGIPAPRPYLRAIAKF